MTVPTITRFLRRYPELGEPTEKVLTCAARVREARARALPMESMPGPRHGPRFPQAESELFAAVEKLEDLARTVPQSKSDIPSHVRRVMTAAMTMRAESHTLSPRRTTTSPAARSVLFQALSAFEPAFRELETRARACHAPRIPWQIELATHVAPETPVAEMRITGYELPRTPAARKAWGERCFLSGTPFNTDSHASPALRYRSLDSCFHTLAPSYHALWRRLRAALEALRPHHPEAVEPIVRLFPSLYEEYVLERSSPTFAGLGLLDLPSLAVSLNNLFRAWADRPLFGSRRRRGKLASLGVADRCAVARGARSGYVWETYGTARTQALRLAYAFEQLGLTPGARLGILSRHNCREVYLAEFAAIFARLVSVGLPESLSDEHLAASTEQMGISAIVVDRESLHRFIDRRWRPAAGWLLVFGSGGPDARCEEGGPRIIDLDALVAEEVPASWSSPSGVSPTTGILYDDHAGRQAAEAEGIRLDEDGDLYTILLTSGSTGRPKGTVVTRRRWAEEMCFDANLWPHVSVSFQPSALAADRGSVWRTLTNGGRVGFARRDAGLWDDIQALRPTILDVPPVIWNTLYREYRQATRDPALTSGEVAAIRYRFKTYLGGRLAFVATGGAPSDPGVRRTLESILGVPMRDSYGTTETGNIATDGVLLPGLDYRLVDLPDLGFTSADEPCPRGELAVRTPHTTARYWQDEASTREGFTDDGYFLTGDIVEIGPGRRCTLLGRRRQLFKLADSEFVSPEMLERHYLKSEQVEALLIAGSPSRDAVVAIAVPSRDDVTESGLLAELRAIARREGLRPGATPIGVILEPRAEGGLPWSVENGLLTPSFKLERRALEAKYRDRIETLCTSVRSARLAVMPSGDDDDGHDLDALTRRLSQIFAAVLSLPPEEIDDQRSFVEHGGDSLATMELRLRLDQVFSSKSMPRGLGDDNPAFLVESPLAEVARHIASRRSRPEVDRRTTGEGAPSDLSVDSSAGTALRPPAGVEAAVELANADAAAVFWPGEPPPASTRDHVFLTGATGFLGVHLLAELVSALPAGRRLFALVRAEDDAAARDRLLGALRGASLEVPEIGLAAEPDDARVIAVAGRLTAERLGLTERTYARLAAEVGLIYHVAARVSLDGSYRELRGANVEGTRRVLELATTKTLKSFHFVSSLNVALLLGQVNGGRVDEKSPLAAKLSPRIMSSNPSYGVTKWACEAMIQQLFRHYQGAFRVSVSRPALLIWSQATGYANRDDWLPRTLSSCLLRRRAIGPDEVGVPRWVPETPVSVRGLDMVPVDFAARAIARLGELTCASGLPPEAAESPSRVPTFHVSNTAPAESGIVTLPRLMDLLVAADLRRRGASSVMEFVPLSEWLSLAEIESAEVRPILPQLRSMVALLARTKASCFTAALAASPGGDGDHPPFDRRLMETFVRQGPSASRP